MHEISLTDGSELEFFVGLETAVWQALVEGDAAADERCLSADFLGVYPSGFASREDHVSQLQDGPSVIDYVLSDARLTVVSDEAALLSYRAVFVRVGSMPSEAMYVTSLWCQRNDSWINTFSQDTPAPGLVQGSDV